MCLHMQIPCLYPRTGSPISPQAPPRNRGQAEKEIWGAQAEVGSSGWSCGDAGLYVELKGINKSPSSGHAGGDPQTCILSPRSPVGIGPGDPVTLCVISWCCPSKPAVPRCSDAPPAYSVLNPCAVKRLCVERSPQLELLMSRGRGGNHLAGEALLVMPGDVESPSVCWWSGPAPTPWPAENREAPSANYLPSRGFLPPIWGFRGGERYSRCC